MANLNVNPALQQLHDVVFEIESSAKKGDNKFIQINQNSVSTTADNTQKAPFKKMAELITNLKNEGLRNLESLHLYAETIDHFRKIEQQQIDTGFFAFFNFFPSQAEIALKNIHPEHLWQEHFLKTDLSQLSGQDLYEHLIHSKIRSEYLPLFNKDHKEMIERAVKSNLSESQALAILIYTSEAYLVINAYLRGQEKVFRELVDGIQYRVDNKSIWDTVDFEKIRKAKPVIGSKEEVYQYYKNEARLISDLIDQGYSALLPYVGQVYRGDLLSDEELKLMNTGEYYDPAFLSFSTDRGVSEFFTLRGPTNQYEKHPVLIEVASKSGRETSLLSDKPNEQEVTFRKGQRFVVKEKKEIEVTSPDYKVTKKVQYFLLEEK